MGSNIHRGGKRNAGEGSQDGGDSGNAEMIRI
jgi:hypothetical protein